MTMPPSKPNRTEDEWAMHVETTARAFAYPPTPDLTPAVRAAIRRRSAPPTRRLAVIAAALVLVVLGLMAVPSIRAAVLQFLRVGAIELQIGAPTATATAPAARPTRSSPRAGSTPFQSALDLPGEITLDQARSRDPRMVRLPAYPPDLGEPDRVFSGPMLTFVWTEPGHPDRVRLVLGVLHSASGGAKEIPFEPTPVHIDGHAAYWVEEPHTLMIFSGTELQRWISAHVLLWVDGVYTFRLETEAGKDEAIKIAESLP